jgi:hypothetical protein
MDHIIKGNIIKTNSSIDGKKYFDHLKEFSTIDNLEEFLKRYSFYAGAVILVLIMFFLSFLFDCLKCNIINFFILIVYLYFCSIAILILYIKEFNCYPGSNLNEFKIAFNSALVFATTYLLINVVVMFVPVLNLVLIRPFDILLCTIVGLIALYFYNIRAIELSYQYTCIDKKDIGFMKKI